LVNRLLEQSRYSNLEQLLTSRLISLLLLEQLSFLISGQRLRLNLSIEVFEQLSSTRLLTSNSVNSINLLEQSSSVNLGQLATNKLLSMISSEKSTLVSSEHLIISKLVSLSFFKLILFSFVKPSIFKRPLRFDLKPNLLRMSSFFISMFF